MELSLFCRAQQLPGGDISRFAEVAQMADEAGFRSIHLGEHVLMGDNTEAYPFGRFEPDPDAAWPDPLVTLASAIAVTTRIRFSTGVLLAPLRPGPVLAKEIATLDALSGGRAEPGLGIGWQREEFQACGVSWEDRYKTFDEVVRTCRALWESAQATVPGQVGAVSPVRALPRPAQRRIPLLMGLAPTPRNARRIAEYGDGWCPVRYTPEKVREGLAVIRPVMAEAGRDADELIVRVQAPLVLDRVGRIDVPATVSVIPEYQAAGATVLAVGPTVGCASLREVERLITEIAEESGKFGAERSNA
ncbi:TIGR03619 family F420-dependent LLM class oxidoreductase [Nocardia fusca]|uniref:TIGR03619 family F420-dependent LLM class oxidoreductase n=1 Tax=Nocardia fusca TaxID=941183 RepID=UPI0007A74D6C|nr:TIGR03619 family F420-dependent LLM class oxidoreductase [Nocardia fusca]